MKHLTNLRLALQSPVIVRSNVNPPAIGVRESNDCLDELRFLLVLGFHEGLEFHSIGFSASKIGFQFLDALRSGLCLPVTFINGSKMDLRDTIASVIDHKYRNLLRIVWNLNLLLSCIHFKELVALNAARVNDLDLDLIDGYACVEF